VTDLFPPNLSDRRAPLPQAVPQRPTSDISCRYCGSRPALDIDFEQHTGMLLLRQTRTFPGPFCRDCGLNVFRSATAHTLGVGWLGMISFFIFPFVVLRNVLKRRLLNGLADPVPPADATVRPAQPGKPLFARPLTYAVLGPFLLLAGAGVQIWWESPGRQIDKCVLTYGSAADVVDCAERHDGVITAVADDPSDCPSGTITAVWLRSPETSDVFCVGEG